MIVYCQKNAGVNACAWAIMHQEEMHGITWHVISSGIDTGAIILNKTIKITKDDNAFSLNLKSYNAAIKTFFFVN